MLLAMVVGISVGLGSPLTATFVVPEMTGHLSLVPAAALAAFGSTLLARSWTGRRGAPTQIATNELHDEDA